MNRIKDYTDGWGLVSNALVPPGTMRSSDNGVLHTSRYVLVSGEIHYLKAIFSCIDEREYLHRAPDDPSENVPDDHYGAYSVGFVTKLPWKCMHPVLLYMRGLNRGNVLAHLFSPLVALIIAFSNFKEKTEETSDRLLTWNIIQGTKPFSWLCRLGGKAWARRQNHLYKHPNAIKVICTTYYGAEHPITQGIEY